MSWAKALFEPRSVAVVGSASPGKLGRVLIDQLLAGGFDRVSIVGPKGHGALGVPGFRSIGEIASPPDLVIVASPADTVTGVIEDAGRAGAKAAVILTAGFSEVGKRAEEQALLEAARRSGVRLVGPNCAGIVNTKASLFPTLETRPPAGEVAFVSQSGALGGAVLAWAEEQGVGFSKFVSYGNGVDLTDVDFLDMLRTDDDTKVVALYVETVSDGRAFLAAAARLAATKPLVVIKAGRSASGGRAALSHTGSLSGSDAVYDAALRQCGAIRVAGVEEMFDLCRGFTTLPPVRGKRVVIVTNSGGPGVLAADAADAAGLEIRAPSETLRGRLAASEHLSALGSLANPIDLTVQGMEDGYREALVAALDEADAALAIDVNVPYLDSAPIARGVVAAARATGKPVAACFMAGRTVASALPILKEGGVPNFATGERAARVLAAMGRYESTRFAVRGSQCAVHGAEPAVRGAQFVVEADPKALRLPWAGEGLEPEALDWLESEGIPTPKRRLVTTADEAADAVGALGGSVVLKVVAAGILHKSDVGGVILGVETPAAARDGFARLRQVGGEGFRGVLVVPTVRGGVELLVGVSHDPQFGPVVAAGVGGVYAEVLRDVTLRVAPIDAAEARTMLDELRGAAILRGARGSRPRDLDAAAGLIAAVSFLPLRYDDLRELDLNPVFLLEDGLVVGDARVLRWGAAETCDRGGRP
ncbi:MAG: acetate--CoA ligase family protein [Candidatus Bipolaricaulis sp.]|nr:acetate--CoA ligase family protein [Candidatus Bipolaricaulis sp.]